MSVAQEVDMRLSCVENCVQVAIDVCQNIVVLEVRQELETYFVPNFER